MKAIKGAFIQEKVLCRGLLISVITNIRVDLHLKLYLQQVAEAGALVLLVVGVLLGPVVQEVAEFPLKTLQDHAVVSALHLELLPLAGVDVILGVGLAKLRLQVADNLLLLGDFIPAGWTILMNHGIRINF